MTRSYPVMMLTSILFLIIMRFILVTIVYAEDYCEDQTPTVLIEEFLKMKDNPFQTEHEQVNDLKAVTTHVNKIYGVPNPDNNIDGNATSETHRTESETTSSSTSSENGDDSNENILPELSAQEIMDTYGVLLESCKTEDEIAIKSLEFVKFIIPEKLWATSPEELACADSDINKYTDNLEKNLKFDNDNEIIYFVHLRASISTYNAAVLNNVLDQKELLIKIHHNVVAQQLAFLQRN